MALRDSDRPDIVFVNKVDLLLPLEITLDEVKGYFAPLVRRFERLRGVAFKGLMFGSAAQGTKIAGYNEEDTGDLCLFQAILNNCEKIDPTRSLIRCEQ